MSKEMNQVKQAIKNHLDERAKTDDLFATAYAKPNKSIDECLAYILGEAKKQGNAVYLSDEVVFGWAIHYYDEDDIKINKLPANTRASVTTNVVELSDEDKEKARKQAMKSYEKQCVAEIKAAEEAKAKKEAEKKKAKREELRKMEQSMPTLFEFDDYETEN